jgi:hypothetical protein
VILETDEDTDVDDDELKNWFTVKKPNWENYTQELHTGLIMKISDLIEVHVIR